MATQNSPDFKSSRGPSLFLTLYLALLAQGIILLYSIYSPRTGEDSKMKIMMGILAASALIVYLIRLPIQDWYSALGANERVILFAFAGLFFMAPSLMPGHRLLSEGFALALFPLLLLAIEQPNVRLYLAVTLIGFWFSLYKNPHADLQLVLAFGSTTLLSLAATHFVFTGEPFNLRGWRMMGRMIWSVIIYFAPAALASYLVFRSWPALPPDFSDRFAKQKAAEDELAVNRMKNLSPEEWTSFFVQVLLGIGAIVLCLIALHYIRKFLNRRRKAGKLPAIYAADVGGLEYSRTAGKVPTPVLGGTRGEIIRLWKKWSRSKEESGIIRSPSETASELALRLIDQSANENVPQAVTDLFEQAHYGPVEPVNEDVERMRELVTREAEDIAR